MKKQNNVLHIALSFFIEYNICIVKNMWILALYNNNLYIIINVYIK